MSVLRKKLQTYYFTAILSFIFAVVGFSYNTWRLELSEDNNNIRMASFEVLKNLSELEQNIYASHYDKDAKEGSPRIGWIKIGLINDLSTLINDDVTQKSQWLKESWQVRWALVEQDTQAVEHLIADIEKVRVSIKNVLKTLQ